MNTHADKSQENKSQSVANAISQKQNGSESTFQFVDNRPEAVAQRKRQEVANNSPQVKQLMAFREMASNSPQAKQAAQLQAMAENNSAKQQQPIQKKASPESSRRENKTGLPDNVKTGMENLSGMSLDDVKVHRNSDKPAQLQAHAYAQGTDIHLGPGQEKHLPHEAWHVVQQKQRRVKPTMQMKGKVNINDDASLEKEADVMGAIAAKHGQDDLTSIPEYAGVDTKRLTQQALISDRETSSVGVGLTQLKRVDVSGGTFEDVTYITNDSNGKLKHRGAKMHLKFEPAEGLDAEEVSLVQTTNSKLQNETHPDNPDQEESLLDERRTKKGTAIDQQIYLPEQEIQKPKKGVFPPQMETHKKGVMTNLDPRYHEERTTLAEPLYDPKGVFLQPGQAAVKIDAEVLKMNDETYPWRPAYLKDMPGQTVESDDVLTGGERFEVAALADGKEYIGSISWGWKIDDSTGMTVLDPSEIKLESRGSASLEFNLAAEAWNKMPVPDLETGELMETIKLPYTNAALAYMNARDVAEAKQIVAKLNYHTIMLERLNMAYTKAKSAGSQEGAQNAIKITERNIEEDGQRLVEIVEAYRDRNLTID